MEGGQHPGVLQEQQQQQVLLTDVLFEATIEKEHFGDHILEVRNSRFRTCNATLAVAHAQVRPACRPWPEQSQYVGVHAMASGNSM